MISVKARFGFEYSFKPLPLPPCCPVIKDSRNEREFGESVGLRGTFCKPKKKSAKQLLGRLLYVDQASLKVLLTSALKKQKLSVLSNGLSLFLLSGMYFAEFQGI